MIAKEEARLGGSIFLRILTFLLFNFPRPLSSRHIDKNIGCDEILVVANAINIIFINITDGKTLVEAC